MGLKPIANGHTVTVTVGESSYQLREMVSMAELEKTRRLIAKSLSHAARAAGLYERFMNGEAVNYDEIEPLLTASDQASYEVLHLWLVDWSHTEELNRANIERLEAADQKAINRHIRERSGEGKANPTTQDAPSTGSSEPSSSTDESTGTV